MKATCVTDKRELELREVPSPADPPSGPLLLEIEACAINHGDKTFLARPRRQPASIQARTTFGEPLARAEFCRSVPASLPLTSEKMSPSTVPSHRVRIRLASGLSAPWCHTQAA
jgi:hypothetical protein